MQCNFYLEFYFVIMLFLMNYSFYICVIIAKNIKQNQVKQKVAFIHTIEKHKKVGL